MFVHEPQPIDRKMSQAQTDKMIEEKLGSPILQQKLLHG